MFVLVSADGGDVSATIQDTQNFKQLHAEFRGVADAAADRALRDAGLGLVDGDHVWLVSSALRTAGAGDADWNEQFGGMLRYAASKGWADSDLERVRAHIVRS